MVSHDGTIHSPSNSFWVIVFNVVSKPKLTCPSAMIKLTSRVLGFSPDCIQRDFLETCFQCPVGARHVTNRCKCRGKRVYGLFHRNTRWPSFEWVRPPPFGREAGGPTDTVVVLVCIAGDLPGAELQVWKIDDDRVNRCHNCLVEITVGLSPFDPILGNQRKFASIFFLHRVFSRDGPKRPRPMARLAFHFSQQQWNRDWSKADDLLVGRVHCEICRRGNMHRFFFPRFDELAKSLFHVNYLNHWTPPFSNSITLRTLLRPPFLSLENPR